MTSLTSKMEAIKDFKVTVKTPDDVAVKRKAVERGAQQFAKIETKEIKRAAQEAPSGAAFIILARVVLNDRIAGLSKEATSNEKRRAVLVKAVKDALDCYLCGALGPKCRSVGCLRLALGLIFDLVECREGFDQRAAALKELEKVYFDAERRGTAFMVEVDPVELDALPPNAHELIADDWPWPSAFSNLHKGPFTAEEHYEEAKLMFAKTLTLVTRVALQKDDPESDLSMKPVELCLCDAKQSLPAVLLSLMRSTVDKDFIGVAISDDEDSDDEGPAAKKRAMAAAKRTAAKKKESRDLDLKRLDEVLKDAEARAAQISSFLERKLGAEQGADAPPTPEQLTVLLDTAAVDVDTYKRYIEKLPKDVNTKSFYSKDDVPLLLESVNLVRTGVKRVYKPPPTMLGSDMPAPSKRWLTEKEFEAFLATRRMDITKKAPVVCEIHDALSQAQTIASELISVDPATLLIPASSSGAEAVLCEGDLRDYISVPTEGLPGPVKKELVQMKMLQEYRPATLEELKHKDKLIEGNAPSRRVTTGVAQSLLKREDLIKTVQLGLVLEMGLDKEPAPTPLAEAANAKNTAMVEVFNSLLGHAALEMIAGRRTAEEVVAIFDALSPALSLKDDEQKVSKFVEAVVDKFGQDARHRERILKSLEPLKSAPPALTAALIFPLTVPVLLAVLPPAPEGGGLEAAEAHVLQVKAHMENAILTFLGRLDAAKSLDPSVVPQYVMWILGAQAYQKLPKEDSNSLESLADIPPAVRAGPAGLDALATLPLLDLATIYWDATNQATSAVTDANVMKELEGVLQGKPFIDVEALQAKAKGRGGGGSGGGMVKLTAEGVRALMDGMSADDGVQASSSQSGPDSLPPFKDFISTFSKLTSGLHYGLMLKKGGDALLRVGTRAGRDLAKQELEDALDAYTTVAVLAGTMDTCVPALLELVQKMAETKAALGRAAAGLHAAVEDGNDADDVASAIAAAEEAVENLLKELQVVDFKKETLISTLNNSFLLFRMTRGLTEAKATMVKIREEHETSAILADEVLSKQYFSAEKIATGCRDAIYSAVTAIQNVDRLHSRIGPLQARHYASIRKLLIEIQTLKEMWKQPRNVLGIGRFEMQKIGSIAINLALVAKDAHLEGDGVFNILHDATSAHMALDSVVMWYKSRITEALVWETGTQLIDVMAFEVLGPAWVDQMAMEALDELNQDEDFISGGVAAGTGGGTKAAKKAKKKKKKGAAPARNALKDLEAEEEEEEDEEASTSAAASPEVAVAGAGGAQAVAGAEGDEEDKLAAAVQRAREEEEAQRAAWAAQRALELQHAQQQASNAAPAAGTVTDGAGTPKKRSKQRKKGAAGAEEPAVSPSPPAPERAPSPQPAGPSAAEDDDEGWEVQAPKHRRQQQASGSNPAEPAESKTGAPEDSRFVSWTGEWACGQCGTVYEFKDSCKGCDVAAPCRDFANGHCKRSVCRRIHPQFDLKAMGSRPAHVPKGVLLVEPRAGHIWGEPRQGAAPVPAVEARAPRRVAAVKAPEPRPPMMPPVAPPRGLPPQQAPMMQVPPAPAPIQFGAPPGIPTGPMALPTPVTVQANFGDQPDLSPWPSAALSAASGLSAPATPATPAAESDNDYANMMASLGVTAAPTSPVRPGWGPPGAATAPPLYSAVTRPLGDVWPAAGESQEDAELKAAMEASLRDQKHLEEARAAAYAAAGEWSAAAPSDASLEPSVATGLANETGEYNCFLNVVVQCLWHCYDFRTAVMSWPPELYNADPVVQALRSLFDSLAEFEAQAAAGSGGARAVVNPSQLREALAAVDARFATRQMADAGELLEQIFKQVTVACAAAGVPNVADRVFGLRVAEEVSCPACNAVTHRRGFVQHWHTAAATALRLLSFSVEGDGGLGALLSALHDQEEKTCDADAGGCGRWCKVLHMLDDRAPPGVFALQLAWESHAEDAADIAATMAILSETVDLADVYKAVERGTLRYRLRALVAYYGQHYEAFVRPYAGSAAAKAHGEGVWLLVDDARAAAVGGWDKVVAKCGAGRIQPSVLFYEREA